MGVDLGVMLAKPTAGNDRTIEIVTGEIIELKKTAGDAILGIGHRLLEAKGLLTHGEWLPWLTEQVEFSERTAQNFMRLSREWSNPQALADLGATKALTLLALPPEERDDFLSGVHDVDGEEKTAIDMSARELEQAIRERKEALAAKEQAEQATRDAEQARDKMAADMKLANARIESLSETEAHLDDVISDLRKELKELHEQPIDAAFSEVPDDAALEAARQEGAEVAAKAARKEAEEKLKAKIEKAEKAKADAEAQVLNIKAAQEAAVAKAEAMEKQLKLVSNPAATEFKVYFAATQKDIAGLDDCLERLRTSDADLYSRLTDAMAALGKQICDDAAARQGGGVEA